jgi:hypothetical protein
MFVVSISISSVGVFLDNITTRKFIGDIGIEYEWNCIFRKLVPKYGYRLWVILEVLVVTFLGLFDTAINVAIPGTIFCGLLYGSFRILASGHNYFDIIGKYRKMGIEKFFVYSADSVSNQKTQRSLQNKKRMLYLLSFSGCLLTLLFMIPFVYLQFGFIVLTSNFGMVLSVMGFIMGIMAYLFAMLNIGNI